MNMSQVDLPSFDSCKQVFVRAYCIADPTAYLLICDVLGIEYVEESSVASHVHCLYSVLKVDSECPAFAFIQEDRYHARTHQTGL